MLSKPRKWISQLSSALTLSPFPLNKAAYHRSHVKRAILSACYFAKLGRAAQSGTIGQQLLKRTTRTTRTTKASYSNIMRPTNQPTNPTLPLYFKATASVSQCTAVSIYIWQSSHKQTKLLPSVAPPQPPTFFEGLAITFADITESLQCTCLKYYGIPFGMDIRMS